MDLTPLQWISLLAGPLGALAIGAIFNERTKKLIEDAKPSILEKAKADAKDVVRDGINTAIQDGRPIVLNLAATQTQGIVEHAIRTEREHLDERFASKIGMAEIKIQLHHVADEMKKFGEEMKGYDSKLDRILDALLKR